MVAMLEEKPGVAPVNLSEAGSWLCERHSQLRELVERIGAWDDALGSPSLWRVREAVAVYDAAFHDSLVLSAPDAPVKAVAELRAMSPSEVGRLRLLATLAPRPFGPGALAVEFHVDDLSTFDKAGKALVYDWLRCVRIGVLG